MAFRRLTDVGNEEARSTWVADQLGSAAAQYPGGSILDVGAGERPYKGCAEGLGLSYRSHDFAEYDGLGDCDGLQCGSWEVSGHDLVCDVLEIPDSFASDIVLCTEVLEHVPDAVRAFQALVRITKPGGILIVTVPFLSLMHQAPFWFQSGLSPYWFEYWAGSLGVEVQQLLVSGDYVDLMRQEIGRMSGVSPYLSRLWGLSSPWFARRARSQAPEALRNCGGFGTFFVGQVGVITSKC